MMLSRHAKDGLGPNASVSKPIEDRVSPDRATFMFFSFGNGEERSSGFTVSVGMDDVRTIIEHCARMGGKDAIDMQRDLALAAAVRRQIDTEKA